MDHGKKMNLKSETVIFMKKYKILIDAKKVWK